MYLLQVNDSSDVILNGINDNLYSDDPSFILKCVHLKLIQEVHYISCVFPGQPLLWLFSVRNAPAAIIPSGWGIFNKYVFLRSSS